MYLFLTVNCIMYFYLFIFNCKNHVVVLRLLSCSWRSSFSWLSHCFLTVSHSECTMRVSLQPRCSAAICWSLCARLCVPKRGPHPTQSSTSANGLPLLTSPSLSLRQPCYRPLHSPSVNEGFTVNLTVAGEGGGRLLTTTPLSHSEPRSSPTVALLCFPLCDLVHCGGCVHGSELWRPPG